MKISVTRSLFTLALVAASLGAGGCASLARPAPASTAGAASDGIAKPTSSPDDEIIVLSHCCWDVAEPRKRAEAAVMW